MDPRRFDGALAALLAGVARLLVLVVLAIFAATFVLQPSRIPSESMQPTLDVGDFLLIDKQSFTPAPGLDWALPPKLLRRGDLAVFHFPVDPRVFFVKRIVALAGDRVRLRGGRLVLGGQPVPEPYATFTPAAANAFRDDFPTLAEIDPEAEPAWWEEIRRQRRESVRRDALEAAQPEEVRVPPGACFALGDNRNDSLDSRYWGFVPEDAIVGRPFLVDFTLPPADPSQPLRARLAAMLHGLLHGMRVVR